MKHKCLKYFFIVLSMVVTSNAYAGLITDTTSNSFIDNQTGLEWMDFGINNGRSYNDVASQLTIGGDYYGWHLASAAQVYEMWANAFLGLGAGYENANQTGSGELRVTDGATTAGSIFSGIFDVMGFNTSFVNPTETINFGGGWFAGGRSLGVVRYNRYIRYTPVTQTPVDVAYLKNNFTYAIDRNSPTASMGTMLVKTSAVPEPPSLAIIALGLLGLGLRRKNRV